MDWIRPWLCKHVNRRCLPYVLSPRPAALSRAVLCRPQGADGGRASRSEACKPQATESAVHITARECTRLLSLLGAVWGAWGPTVSVIHYLYANNHIERASAL
jgi:hypothetical protein